MPLPRHSPDTPTTPAPCPHVGSDGEPRHVHGTRNAYRFDECRCEPCRESIRTYDRARRRAKLYGRWQATVVDAGPVLAHAAALRAAGMSRSQIETASGVGHAAVGRLVTGRDRGKPVTRVAASTAARIIAVPIPSFPPERRGNVSAAGTRRRLQALMWVGWSLAAIGHRIGMDRRNVAALLKQAQVSRATAAAVRDVYEDLWNMRPPQRTKEERYAASRARGEALRRGYAPPLAWDDETIDDPGAAPQGVVGALRDRRAAIVEDCEVIAADGGTLQAAAARLEMTASNLTRSLYRAGRADLVAALTRQARGEDAPGGTRGVARSRRARAS